jgi:hypothetical protein
MSRHTRGWKLHSVSAIPKSIFFCIALGYWEVNNIFDSNSIIIFWQSILQVDETASPEKHGLFVSHFWKVLSYNVVSRTQYTIVGSQDNYSTLQVYQRSYSQVRHIPPKMSDKFESQHSPSPTIWSNARVDIKRFFFTFLEVNMSNILWSIRICKRTFFPVCRMCG